MSGRLAARGEDSHQRDNEIHRQVRLDIRVRLIAASDGNRTGRQCSRRGRCGVGMGENRRSVSGGGFRQYPIGWVRVDAGLIVDVDQVVVRRHL